MRAGRFPGFGVSPGLAGWRGAFPSRQLPGVIMARGGFRSVGSIAAELVSVTRRVDLPVGDCTATVLEAEGCAQLIWHRGEPGPLVGPGVIWNDFLASGTGAQLRTLADAVDAAAARMDAGGHGK